MAYAAPVPVSRKRKKKRPTRPAQRSGVTRLATGPGSDGMRNAIGTLLADRRGLGTHRESLAAKAAENLVPELVELAATTHGADLEDELCERLGARMLTLDREKLGDHVGPTMFLEAILSVATQAVLGGIDQEDPEPVDWQGPWNLLVTLGRIAPYPLNEQVVDAVKELRAAPGGRALPVLPDGPRVAGTVLWTRDVYGSRFGVVAPISTPDGPDRWYLWDIDACGFQPFTVHAAYLPGPDQALARWRANVGELAGGDAALAPVADGRLLSELLPAEEGILRLGGEGEAQMVEYHRSKRLADEVRQVVGMVAPAEPADPLNATKAGAEFADWRTANRPDAPQPPDFDEVLQELADSWSSGGPEALYHTCSPHRVASVIPHIRDYYLDDFAAQILSLLPDWTAWLAERNGTPTHLADRCLPFVDGESHPAVHNDRGELDYFAPVIE
jgi:hypothetical protein